METRSAVPLFRLVAFIDTTIPDWGSGSSLQFRWRSIAELDPVSNSKQSSQSFKTQAETSPLHQNAVGTTGVCTTLYLMRVLMKIHSQTLP